MFILFLKKMKMWLHVLFPLKHKRNERFDACFVIRVLFREMPGEKLLFLACPEPGSDKRNGECDEEDSTAVEDCRAKNHKQKTAINRMAHIAVRAALHKLVVPLQDSACAPVAAKNSTRPEHDNETDESNNVGDNADHERVRPQDRVMVNHKKRNRHCNQQN